MSNPQHAQAQGRPVWLFMAATAMATTVSTLAATAMVKAEATEPVAVECTCQSPAPAPAESPAPVAEATAPQAPEPAEAAPAEQHEQVTAPAQPEQAPLPKAEVEGALDKEVIRRIVRAHINEIRYCYNEGLTLDPELAGRVVVQATVGKDGKVARSEVESTDMDGEVPGCIAEAMGRWMFPRPADGKDVVITYPFLLEPG